MEKKSHNNFHKILERWEETEIMTPTSEMQKLKLTEVTARVTALSRAGNLVLSSLASVCCWTSAYLTMGARAVLAKSCVALPSTGVGGGWSPDTALLCLPGIALDRRSDPGPLAPPAT